MEVARVLLIGMAAGGTLTLLTIRAEMWWNAWNERRKRRDQG